MESLQRDQETEAPQTVEVTPAPVPMQAAAQVTAPPAPVSAPMSDDTTPMERANKVPEFPVSLMGFNKETKTLTVEASDLGIDSLPRTLSLKKSNGQTALFTQTREIWSDEEELLHTEYSGPNGLSLWILND